MVRESETAFLIIWRCTVAFSKREFVELLREWVEGGIGEQYGELPVRTETFSVAGVLTSDDGLVVRLGDHRLGEQTFYLTVQEK